MIKLSDIERFIREAGSDDLCIFGGDTVGGAHIQQVPSELATFVMMLLEIQESGERKLQNYLEIGTASGGTAMVLDHFIQFENMILIDDNSHPTAALRPSIMKDCPHDEYIGKSFDPEIVHRVSETGLWFDLMFIDGDHTYEAVKQDIGLYLPFLRDNTGLLALHDTAYERFGVRRVMEELMADVGMQFIGEIVAEQSPRCGIALFMKGEPKFVWDGVEETVGTVAEVQEDTHLEHDENTVGESFTPKETPIVEDVKPVKKSKKASI